MKRFANIRSRVVSGGEPGTGRDVMGGCFKWQGPLLSFTMSGAMALALSSCNQSSGPVMIEPPQDFDPGKASYLSNTNAAPTAPYVYNGGGGGGGTFLTARGYYPIYGYPGYYDRPAPGSRVELVTGSAGAESYRAGSTAEARESVARGGFGSHSSGGGEGEGGHGGGEGGGHGGGGE